MIDIIQLLSQFDWFWKFQGKSGEVRKINNKEWKLKSSELKLSELMQIQMDLVNKNLDNLAKVEIGSIELIITVHEK